MAVIILESGIRITIPDYDNLEKIGSKTKLKQLFQKWEDEGTYTMEDILQETTISKIGRTYYLDVG
jgi:hypothetical protein